MLTEPNCPHQITCGGNDLFVHFESHHKYHPDLFLPLTSPLSLSPAARPTSSTSKRSLDLGLESPGEDTSAAPATSGKAPGGRRGKTKKPAAARARRGMSRTQATVAARGSSADPGESREAAAATAAVEEEIEARAPAPKRKVPAGRKTRAARQASGAGTAAAPIEILAVEGASGGEEECVVTSSGTDRRRRHQASPSARRERSPTRRGAGRPDTWADRGTGGSAAARKPSSPLSSPLRPITNYTSEGDRPPRTKAKVRGRRGF